MTPTFYRVHPDPTWYAPDRTSMTGSADLRLGIDKPGPSNTGAGVIRPFPTTTVAGAQTISTSQTIRDKVYADRVTVNSGATVVFENCYLKGPLTFATSSFAIVDTTASTLTTLRYCTVKPQTPSPYIVCVGYKNYRLEYCDVSQGTDNWGAYAKSTDPDPKCNIAIVGTWSHDMARFAPDPATGSGRPETHNDLIQLQGNLGPVDDILIDGCNLEAYHSTTVGDLPPVHKQISAVMLTPITQDSVAITLTRSWVSGGIYTFNAGGAQPGSKIVVTDNRWERPRTNGPVAAIAIDASITDRVISGNVYDDDGSPVPVTNA